MADEQKKYPYPSKEFFQELTDQIMQWVYDNFSPKTGTDDPVGMKEDAYENN